MAQCSADRHLELSPGTLVVMKDTGQVNVDLISEIVDRHLDRPEYQRILKPHLKPLAGEGDAGVAARATVRAAIGQVPGAVARVAPHFHGEIDAHIYPSNKGLPK